MKRFISFWICTFLVCSTGFAKKDDAHLLQMVQCINDSDFNCAQNELSRIKRWENTTLALSIGNAITFYYDIILSDEDNPTSQNKKIQQKLARFIANEAKEYAEYLCNKDKYETAVSYREISLDFYKNAEMQNTIDYASALGDIGVYYDNMDDSQNAESYYLFAIQQYEEIEEIRNWEYLTFLSYLADLYSRNGNYQKAHDFFSKAISIYTSQKKKKSKDYIYTIRALAHLCFNEGNTVEAEKYYKEAQNLAESVVGKDHILYLNILRDMVSYYRSIGDDDNLQQYQQDVVLSAMGVYGPESAECGYEWMNLASVMYDKELIDYAEKFYIRAAEIIKGDIGELTTSYVECIINLGQILLEKGIEKEAEHYFTQAQNIVGQLEGDNNISYAHCLNILGHYYWKTGYYDNVYPFFSKAIGIYEAYEIESEDYAKALYDLGSYFVYANKYSDALITYLKYCEVYEKINLSDNHEYLDVLHEISYIYQILNEPALSQEYAQKASNIEKSNIESIESEAQSLAETIQGYHRMLENYDTYVNLLGEDIIITTKNAVENIIYAQVMLVGLKHGNKSNESVNTLIKFSDVCIENGELSAGLSLAERCSAILRTRMLSTTEFMTEAQRKAFWNMYSTVFYEFFPKVSYNTYMSDQSALTFAYNNELFLKGVLLRSSEAIQQSVLNSGDSILIAQWEQLSLLNKKIALLQERSPQSESIQNLTQQANELEKLITKSSAEYREKAVLEAITCDTIRQVLKPNQVAIEYMTVPLTHDTTLYCALILRDTCSNPIMIPLFRLSQELTQLLLSAAGNRSMISELYGNDELGRALSTLFWGNVKPYLNADDEVFFSPTGILHQIAIENLPYDETHTMADVYHLVRLSSTRELAMRKQPIRHTYAALYGDIAYQEMDANTMLALSSKYNDGTRAATPSRLVDLSQEFEPTAPLPGTKAEIDSIAPILKKQHIAVKVYAQQEACEESVKALSGQKRNILHISTHGFFRPDNRKNSDPMDRCGLYFAGVDKVLKDGNSALPGNVDDGILTAKEISLLDLRDADLVVLSACETGLGDISGEGVFGLQRAFKMAGARTILMTLWRVHDDATRMLMTAFYRHYGQTHDKRTAFRAAQQEVRATYQDPYYWAGFIMLD